LKSNTKETGSWAALGTAQDITNVVFVLPSLIISGIYTAKGSIRAFLVWLGIQIYLIYSYFIYAFFIHFGPMFPVYIAILGLSFYTMIGGLINLKLNELEGHFTEVKIKGPRIFLLVISIVFYILELLAIFESIFKGKVPQSIIDYGLPVNPAHVLDMALLLPGAIITSMLLKKRKMHGLIFAVPLMVFIVAMGIASLFMVVVSYIKDMPVMPIMIIILLLSLPTSLYFIISFIRQVNAESQKVAINAKLPMIQIL
jgi:hypothetical protein